MITMNSKWHDIAQWNFSLWFALLSPVIGILLGILGVFLLTTERRHKDENDKSQTNQRGKATEMVSTATPLARSARSAPGAQPVPRPEVASTSS